MATEDSNKFFNRVTLVLCVVPAISCTLVYSLAFHVWLNYGIWPFHDSNPDYGTFTGLLRIHNTIATLFVFYLFPVSFCFWVFGLFDVCLNKKNSIYRVLALFTVFGLWWLIQFLDPYKIFYWFWD